MIPGRLRQLARAAGLDLPRVYHALSAASLRAALREQGLWGLYQQLREIVPDLSSQYTRPLPTEYRSYWELKIRALHAFQMACALEALRIVDLPSGTVVDIGDSSGTHARYLRALAGGSAIARVVGVNMDPQAVARIRAHGGEAILARAEDFDIGGDVIALYLCFETLEHLTDPLRFLHRLAETGKGEHILVTVPWRRRSRFGGSHLRQDEQVMSSRMTAEEVHIFEFCPADWQLLARLAGYQTIWSKVYRQYPKRSAFRLLAPLWRRVDFEGFVALFLRRDLRLARRYTGW